MQLFKFLLLIVGASAAKLEGAGLMRSMNPKNTKAMVPGAEEASIDHSAQALEVRVGDSEDEIDALPVKADYKSGETGSLDCPADYSKITSSEDCKTAAGALSKPFDDISDESGNPDGCFEDEAFVGYNTGSAMASSNSAPLCKLEASTKKPVQRMDALAEDQHETDKAYKLEDKQEQAQPSLQWLKYTGSGPYTYSAAKAVCAAAGGQLCTKAQYCPHGVISTSIAGDSNGQVSGGHKWTPYRDTENGWIHTGAWGHSQCTDHNAVWGAPGWGITGSSYGTTMCCEIVKAASCSDLYHHAEGADSCSRYANHYGFCTHTHVAWMTTNCAKSCGFCKASASGEQEWTCTNYATKDPAEADRSYSSIYGSQVFQNFDKSKLDSATGWSAQVVLESGRGAGEWMQIDLGGPLQVGGVVTMGAANGQYVKQFTVKYADYDQSWFEIPQTFQVGPERTESKFSFVVRARYVKFIVEDFSVHPSMRAGVLHCTATTCEDTPNWSTNASWATCAVYVQDGHCFEGGVSADYGFGADFNFPEKNCCACGKGRQDVAFTECMAEKECFRKHGNGAPNWVKTCLLCEGKSADETCNAYRECLRKGREKLSDASAMLIKGIQVASGLLTDKSFTMPGLLEVESECQDQPGCYDAEKIVTAVTQDCGCLHRIHDKCDGNAKQVRCLKDAACCHDAVCDCWKRANACSSVTCSSLVDQSNLSLAEPAVRDDTLEESIVDKRSC